MRAVLAESTSFRSAQDLHAQLRQRGQPVGLTTVYRHLQTLAAARAVDLLHHPRRGRRSTGSHHHHLVCRAVG